MIILFLHFWTFSFSLSRTMTSFAGSAIAQGPTVGRIDLWSDWQPTTCQPRWLLLSGASNPPEDIAISKRRTRDAPGDRSGTFLPGVSHDLTNMQDTVLVKATFSNILMNLKLTKSVALESIRELFADCLSRKAKPMIYYTGHGEIGTGNWCFADGKITIQEILNLVPGGCYYPMIFSDACYSGHWANFCLRKGIGGFHCVAACPEYSTAFDTKGEKIMELSIFSHLEIKSVKAKYQCQHI